MATHTVEYLSDIDLLNVNAGDIIIATKGADREAGEEPFKIKYEVVIQSAEEYT